jgi:N-acetylglucosamine kinase-like BadF-type ATPase
MFLGLDGGGTKTAGALVDRQGRLLGRELAGRSAFVGRPSDEACAVLKGVVDALCRQAGVRPDAIAFAGLGLNGVDFPEDLPVQRQVVAEAIGVPVARSHMANDGIVALWGATAAPRAVLLQHGSGFTSAYRNGFGSERLFDHLNVGRQFDLRSEVVRQVARMLDGRTQTTPLRDALLAHMGVTAEEFPEAVYKNRVPLGSRARNAPLVFAAWQAGDPVAADIVAQAARDYAVTVCAMIRHVGGGAVDAVFGGGVIRQAPPEFWDMLTSFVAGECPEAVVKPPALPPDVGAAVMACYHAGGDPAALFEELKRNWPESRGAAS